MRLLRAVSAALLLATALGLVVSGEPMVARGQQVDEAEDAADDAESAADDAESLLSEAAGRRAGLEEELADALVRLAEINAELSMVSVELEELRAFLAQTESELATIDDQLQTQAVDAYVRAVGIPTASLMATDNAETAIVAAAALDRLVRDDRASMAELTIQRRQLERLRERYAEDQTRVAELRVEADEEAAHIESLLAEADAQVAEAVTQARAADAAYRDALSDLETARAQAAERRRQEQRTTTTTTPAGTAASTTTTLPTTTAPPTTPPPTGGDDPPPTTTSTTVPAPEPGGEFAPSVERWRPLVSTYFAAERVDEALAVMSCESYGDPDAYNPYSGASGLFQFLPSTWATTSPQAGFAGVSPFDAEANIGTAAWLSSYYEAQGSDPWSPWTCRPS